ncbi:DUF4440 domain-containing protein [Microbacterium sp. Marseille-Q6965]|uniref:DUF4440 domain-containing protein n=1 Tax=Microbacterium sp. Marseille-Q6965 TaxID=2965072 RepID=UPI0021B7C4F6|nr:DUF4440 domain-containing protein [Microbacterium sp. Marseille-Q6965]
MSDNPLPVRQLRVVVGVDDFDATLRLFRDALGLPERAAFTGDGEARVAILEAGTATLEIANLAQVDMIDRIETDGGTSERVRIAFEVDDTTATTDRLVDAGAQLEASARVTPWRSLNSRVRTPGELQVTLFQELESLEQRSSRPGFRGGSAAATPNDVTEVLERERQLHSPDLRRDSERLAGLLAPDFTEVGASGRTWDRGRTVEMLAAETDAAPIEVHDLAGRPVGPGLVLTTWTSVRAGRRARRTSLWRRDAEGWRIVHHQGTPLPEADEAG